MNIDPMVNNDLPSVTLDLSQLYARIKTHFQDHDLVQDFVFLNTPDKVLLALKDIYQQQTIKIGQSLFKNAISLPCYPYLGLYSPSHHESAVSDDLFSQSGFYGATITQPAVYEAYLHQQLSLLMQSNTTIAGVGLSHQRIPKHFLPNPIRASDHWSAVPPESEQQSIRDCHDPAHEPRSALFLLDDGLSLGDAVRARKKIKPLTLFSGARSDYSLSRLMHYCGTSAEHFQNFVILTNYGNYIQHFLDYARHPARLSQGYTAWAGPMEQWIPLPDWQGHDHPHDDRTVQMPAYHLKKPNKQGITLINIGVGPSNMKTITDHLAVLRSHCWILVGHCAGLDHTQHVGDFVIANAYVRQDRVLDDDLPLHIPIPPIPAVQEALYQSGIPFFPDPIRLQRHIRSGTIITTANRNWELRIQDFLPLIQSSRAIAMDMECATLAANAFRFGVPYGALLCVSDRPLHGELKMPQAAQNFYKERTAQHLLMGIHAMESLATYCPLTLHSTIRTGLNITAFQ